MHTRTSIVTVLAMACGAAMALAQGVEENTYTHDEFGICLAAPEDWTIEKGGGDFLDPLCALSFGDGLLSGGLTAEEADDSSVADLADADEAIFKDGAASFERLRDEELSRTPGEWLIREFSYETSSGLDMHYICLYVKRDARLFALKLYTGGELDGAAAEGVQALFDGFAFLDEPTASGDDPEADSGSTSDGEDEASAGPDGGDEASAGSGGGGATGGTTSGTASGATVEHPWARWAEGSWIEFRIVTETGGSRTEMVQKSTLVRKTAEEITLKMEGKMVSPAAMDMPPSEMKSPARIPAGGGSGGSANATKTGEGDETLDVGGRSLACHWVETEILSDGSRTVTKVWTCDQVPGATVQSETRGAAMTSTMMLTGFEAKK
ncbi:MAG: hypothetical protein HY722_02735 [Planctomycetes bacterium]|nr:hypothetical protein [Planctomycetota bacterium]